MIQPYKFQDELIQATRAHISNKARSVCIQSPTGSGKTIIAGFITEAAFRKKSHVWIVVPRNEILDQFSASLEAFGVPHAIGKAGSQETRAAKVHVWSLDTLVRRINAGKIKNWPDICIFDECHLNLDRQLAIREKAPPFTLFLGCTATPQRLDGRGLSEMYEAIVYGPELQWLVDNHYLSPVRYFAPPIEGLNELHRKGTDYDAGELEELFQRKAVYGQCIQHYKEQAAFLPCLVFCRSVKSAAETAERFSMAGFRFESIDGKLGPGKRAARIKAVADGTLHGLTSCDLVTYGLDVPGLECIIKLRPTLSKALDSQMNGRGLRYQDGKTCIILDHVNAIGTHGHPLDEYKWSFNGTAKHGKEKGVAVATLRLCKNCFMYFEGDICPNCQTARDTKRRPENTEVIDGRLIEVIREPVPFYDQPIEDQRETQIEINTTVADYHEKPGDHHINKLLKIAEKVEPRSKAAQEKWVYRQLNTMKAAPNRSLWHQIGRVRGYSNGWAYFKCKTFYDNQPGAK